MSGHTKEQAEAIIADWNKKLESAINDACEKAYWQFDARRKGYAEWKGRPQSERDAFKAECYMIAKRYILEPENDVSQTLANDLIESEQRNTELLETLKLARTYMLVRGETSANDVTRVDKAIASAGGGEV